MATLKTVLPDFKTEAEEAKWWFDHQEEILDDFERAAEDGTLLTGEAAKVKALPTTTIRLDPADIELARKQAEKKGLKYQTYLKMVIHEALLKNAEASEAKGTSNPIAA
jgi:predicted DNA binding CopG/RHH family protein